MNEINCRGFAAAGIACGIKKSGDRDLGLIFCEKPATAAGVFTRNRVKAAPVLLDRERIAAGRCRAVVVNAGNANCCTGDQGLDNARRMAACVAQELDIDESEVLVASTGVIGQHLPVARIEAAAPELACALDPCGFGRLAEAIMTTDTVPKLVRRQGEIGGRPFTIVGTAKGSGMICPDMATMLCFVCTDAGVASQDLQRCLEGAVAPTLNAITVDGDTSTNDTTLIMASGLSGAVAQTPDDLEVFRELLEDLLKELARMLVRDAEGATKLIEVTVTGAADAREARKVAYTIANSPLVKTACFGEDANWGRIIAAAGRSGVAVDPQGMTIAFDDVVLYDRGEWCGGDAEAAATGVLKKPAFRMAVDIARGTAAASVLTCDFSLDYVRINADYRS
jgi:glutamate N-acetyltransferase/amino-acid N-acetyltransferase